MSVSLNALGFAHSNESSLIHLFSSALTNDVLPELGIIECNTIGGLIFSIIRFPNFGASSAPVCYGNRQIPDQLEGGMARWRLSSPTSGIWEIGVNARLSGLNWRRD